MDKKVLWGLIIGFAGGFFGGLVGLGGGVIMIPMMTAFVRLTQRQAHGTSLVAVVFTGAVGALTYSYHGVVDWGAALILAASAVLFARAGAIYAHSMQERNLKKGFGIFIICVSLLLIGKGLLPGSGGSVSFWSKTIVLLATGVGTGFISGMMGVGGGSVMIPAMVMLAGMPQHLAQGTSLLAMVPVGMIGSFTHYKLGNVHTHLAFGLAAGAIAGSFLGGTTAAVLPDFYLKLIFASIGVWMGVRYVRA
jgi:uncharacterized protein